MSARDVLHTFAARLGPPDARASSLGPSQVQALLLSSRVPEVKTLAQEVLRGWRAEISAVRSYVP